MAATAAMRIRTAPTAVTRRRSTTCSRSARPGERDDRGAGAPLFDRERRAALRAAAAGQRRPAHRRLQLLAGARGGDRARLGARRGRDAGLARGPPGGRRRPLRCAAGPCPRTRRRGRGCRGSGQAPPALPREPRVRRAARRDAADGPLAARAPGGTRRPRRLRVRDGARAARRRCAVRPAARLGLGGAGLRHRRRRGAGRLAVGLAGEPGRRRDEGDPARPAGGATTRLRARAHARRDGGARGEARRGRLVRLRARTGPGERLARDAVLAPFPVLSATRTEATAPARHIHGARMTTTRQALRVGIGGPVGSGKTALTLALCRALRDRYDMAVVTNDIYTREDAEFLARHGALGIERILGVETGGCPHTAIREDASINLEAIERLQRRHPGLELVLVESGGDNLAATFSPELSDLTLYVIDVAAGEKIPRKGGPGIVRSDLLVINKIDLAPH